MALKQDERALLQLVCERGQSYTDLAELLAISEDEVREKARGALTELGGSDPDAEVGLTDYLLGQADPIGRADAVRYLQQDPAARELAETVITKLRVISPGAELPSLPGGEGQTPKGGGPQPVGGLGRSRGSPSGGADGGGRARHGEPLAVPPVPVDCRSGRRRPDPAVRDPRDRRRLLR